MRKFFAWLILLVVTFCAGLGYWYLLWQNEPPVPENYTAEPQQTPQNIDYLLDRLAEIYYREDLRPDLSDPNNLKIIVRNRLVFKFGQPVDLDKKYDTLVTLLGVIKNDLPKIEYIDVSAYRTPAVR